MCHGWAGAAYKSNILHRVLVGIRILHTFQNVTLICGPCSSMTHRTTYGSVSWLNQGWKWAMISFLGPQSEGKFWPADLQVAVLPSSGPLSLPAHQASFDPLPPFHFGSGPWRQRFDKKYYVPLSCIPVQSNSDNWDGWMAVICLINVS